MKQMKHTMKQVKGILDNMVKEEVRRLISDEKIRPDGRGPMKFVHLNRMLVFYQEHMVQVSLHVDKHKHLSVCTLGALGEVQIIDGTRT